MGDSVVILGRGKARWGYNPPVEVKRHYGELSDDPDTCIEQLLWVPAALVSRFGSQYPHLQSEADELFSVGVLAVTEIVRSGKFIGTELKKAAQVKARRAMEVHAGSLGSVISIGKSTRWKYYRSGVKLPTSRALATPIATHDDHTDLLIRDACRPLGYGEVKDLTPRQRRRLKESLL